jgi:Protein of unknown function (DUF3616)
MIHLPVSRATAALLSGIALLLPVSPGLSDQPKLAPAAVTWTVTMNFEKNAEARTNLSGAACVPTAPPFTSCLIANDEKKYAQFFSIEGTSITPGAVIRLMDKDAAGDPDAEGVAYDDGYFYVAGSHGRSRHGDRANDSSYVVFRFPVDKSGVPPFKVSEDDVIGITSTARLRDAIRNGDVIKEFYNQPLASGGVNIEGIAVKDGRMHLGLRGPSRQGQGFILSVDAAALFTPDGDLKAAVTPLALGQDTGIRDLAAVGDGILVLSGPVNDQAVTPAIHHWNDKTGALRQLGDLQIPKDLAAAKAETLLVLQEQPAAWRLLVMFDGPENGAPTEYVVPR